MNSVVLLLAVAAGASVVHASIFKCDSSIIAKIKSDIWSKSPNNDILEYLTSLGKITFKATTPKYLADDIKSVSVAFSKTDGSVYTTAYDTITHKNGDIEYKEGELIETQGAVANKDLVKKRYSVYSQKGVIAFYVCKDSSEAEQGPPAGYVLVKDDYDADDYSGALTNLEYVGIKANVEYC